MQATASLREQQPVGRFPCLRNRRHRISSGQSREDPLRFLDQHRVRSVPASPSRAWNPPIQRGTWIFDQKIKQLLCGMKAGRLCGPENKSSSRPMDHAPSLLDRRCQAVHPAPHIRHAARDPEARPGRKRDHRGSRTASNAVRCEGASDAGIVIRRPFVSVMSIQTSSVSREGRSADPGTALSITSCTKPPPLDAFLFQAAPQRYDEDVAEEPASPIHRDPQAEPAPSIRAGEACERGCLTSHGRSNRRRDHVPKT